MLAVTVACAGVRGVRLGCPQPPTTGRSVTTHRASSPDSSLPAGYGRVVVRLVRADSTEQPVDQAMVQASLLSNQTFPNTFRFDPTGMSTTGRYEGLVSSDRVVISAGRPGFIVGWDTLVVRAGFADTVDLALVPHTYCVDEVSRRSSRGDRKRAELPAAR